VVVQQDNDKLKWWNLGFSPFACLLKLQTIDYIRRFATSHLPHPVLSHLALSFSLGLLFLITFPFSCSGPGVGSVGGFEWTPATKYRPILFSRPHFGLKPPKVDDVFYMRCRRTVCARGGAPWFEGGTISPLQSLLLCDRPTNEKIMAVISRQLKR